MIVYAKIVNLTEDYIENNIDEKILIDDLADYVSISRFHFHRIFKEYTGESIHQFISRVKIERSAMFMLVRKDLTITEIAYRYGYSESSSYTRAFKRHFKMSPRTFKTARNVKTYNMV